MTENSKNNILSQDPSTLYDDASALLTLSRGREDSRAGELGLARGADRTSLASKPDLLPNGSEPRSPVRNHGIDSQLPSPRGMTSLAAEKSEMTSSPASSRSASSKGMVAAAALAAAATVPLPLKKQDQDNQEIEEHPGRKSSSKRKSSSDWPVPASYIVDPDAGVITCICGFDDDDGFTIQCDHCNRWQHAICYGIRDIETAPDDHLCSTCHPRKVDAKRAKRKQQERLGPKNKKRRQKSNQEDDQNAKASSSNSTAQSANVTATGVNEGELSTVSESKPIEKLLTAAEHFSLVYAPLSSSQYKDAYVKKFLDTHSNDDWVLPYNQSTFKALPLEVRPYEENARNFSGLPKLGVYLSRECPSGTFIEEVLGDVDFSSHYYKDPRNDYRIYGTTKPRVFMHPNWPVCIDSRLSGNFTRFLRRSCQPNVELVSIRMKSDKPDVRFVLRALRDLASGEELHIGWQWDLRHPIWHLIKGTNKNVDSLDEQNKFTLVHSIDTILGTTDCGCGKNNRDCFLLKVKRYSQSLVKSAKSKTNSRYKLGEILQNAQAKAGKKPQTSILSRLTHEAMISAERANEMLVDFHAARIKYSKDQRPHLGGGHEDDVSQSPIVSHPKPYKFFLVDRHFTVSRPGPATDAYQKKTENYGTDKVATTTKPLQYDESHITDLGALPLPIELQIPLASSTLSNASEKSPTVPPIASTYDLASSSLVGGVTAPAAITSGSGSGSGSTEIHNTLKKKLSFADYKKKMKPV
ncbi:LAFA_0A02542g1_1 [Lachancea sp. 'fantastica']|nr:LAFA_0A02542g1_1 [Lachancea sp. 'fantastica']